MTVYKPGEDSYMLKNYVSELELEGCKALDMGTGTGLIAMEMAEKGAEVTAVDINPEAVGSVRKKASENNLDVEVKRSDLFENISEKFDIIVFNPPYLPGDSGIGDEEIWRGGEKGVELTEKFLEASEDYLEEEGYCLVVLSSLSEIDEVIERFSLDIVEEKNVWFETLYIARFN